MVSKLPEKCGTSRGCEGLWRLQTLTSEKTATPTATDRQRGKQYRRVLCDDDLLLLMTMEDERNECV